MIMQQLSTDQKSSEICKNDADKDGKEAGTGKKKMKLIVRSQYWGRVLKGKKRCDFEDETYYTISCQAVLSIEGQYWGCCPHHGKRVLELKEHHLQDHHPHDWDLYMVCSSALPQNVFHTFFLLPQSQTVIDIDRRMRFEGWTYFGTVSASTVHEDIGGLLQDFLKKNDEIGCRYHHTHIEILMDQIFDRETPRSRKAANDQARKERGSPVEKNSPSDNKTTNASNKNKKNNNQIVNKQPAIPRVDSNDTTLSETPTNSVTSSNPGMYYENWNSFPNMHCWPAHQPQWYPAAAMPLVMPPNIALRQMLQHPGMVPGDMLPHAFMPFPVYESHYPHDWMMMQQAHQEFFSPPIPPSDGMMEGFRQDSQATAAENNSAPPLADTSEDNQ